MAASSSPEAIRVDLGYVAEETDPKMLHSAYFPSKIGGRPSWLHLSSLPSPESLQCQICGKPTIFLLQIYAPLEDESSCFHRTLFLFICRDPGCSLSNDARNFIVFRSQLPRTNSFFSYDPPNYNSRIIDLSKFRDASDYQALCVVCGCIGTKNCSGCRSRNFCSKEHQKVDWALGGHKGVCNKTSAPPTKDGNKIFLFAEQQIETEPDDDDEDDDDEDESKRAVDEAKEMEKIKQYQGDLADPELEAMASQETSGYKAFSTFKKKIAAAPEQILRYSRGGDPVWISDAVVPSIPPCESCNSPRIFEFQIMPQMLTHLNVDDVGKSIDWGVVCIYTCSKSCDIPSPSSVSGADAQDSAYRREFVIKQDIAST